MDLNLFLATSIEFWHYLHWESAYFVNSKIYLHRKTLNLHKHRLHKNYRKNTFQTPEAGVKEEKEEDIVEDKPRSTLAELEEMFKTRYTEVNIDFIDLSFIQCTSNYLPESCHTLRLQCYSSESVIKVLIY